MNKEEIKHLSEEDLWNYIDNEAGFRQHKHHLDTCEECRELLNELSSFHVSLKEQINLQPSVSFSQVVINRWKAKEVAFPWFIPLLIASFLFSFGLSIYLLSQAPVSLGQTFFQVISFIIVLCTYLLIDLKGTRDNSQSMTLVG